MDEQEFQDEIDLMELASWLLEKLWLILLAGALAGAVAYTGVKLLVKPTYEATAMLIVNTRQDATATVTSDQINSAVKLVETYSIIIRSRTVLEQVIRSLRLDISYNNLYRAVKVSAVGATQVLQVVVTHTDPEMAEIICKTIVDEAPAAIVEAVEAGSVKVVEKAVANPDPVAPHKMRMAALAALAAMAFVCVIIILVHLLDNTIKTEDDVNNVLGWSVLGVIPRYEGSVKK